MSVIPNTYVKYNSYIADANGDHRKVSTWTHADTVEMPDGSSLSDLTFEDNKVTQTATSNNASYRILLSGSADDTTHTEGVLKSANLIHNPAYGIFKNEDTSGLYSKNYNLLSVMEGNATKITTSQGTSSSDAQTITMVATSSGGDVTLTGTNNTWDGTHTSLKDAIAAAGGGGGSTVTITPSLQSGTKVADYVIDGVGGALYAPPAPVEITGTLIAGQTHLTLTDAAITTTATYDFFTDTFGVSPTSAVVVGSGQLALEFEAQQSDVSVKVRVS